MKAAAGDQGAAVRGIVLMTMAAACFSWLDTVAKYLGQTMNTVDVAFLRYGANLLLLVIVLRAWTRWDAFRTGRPVMHILRGLTLMGATFFNFWALRYLALAEAVAIMFAGPLVVTALAGPLLGEKVGLRRWCAVAVGFVGVLIVTRPGTGAMHWAAILSICAMLNYATYSLLTRQMNETERPEALLMISVMVGTLVLSPWSVSAVTSLKGWHWGLALLMGALGLVGHYFLVIAHKIASASLLAPFLYTQMIWMILFGYIIFGDTPDIWTLVGMTVITGAGLYILHRENVRRREPLVSDPAVQ